MMIIKTRQAALEADVIKLLKRLENLNQEINIDWWVWKEKVWESGWKGKG